MARIYESFPLVCPLCAHPMRIVAFITEHRTIVRILEHVGEPTAPPRVQPCRGPPEWVDDDDTVSLDPAVQPEPAFDFDQTMNW